MQLEVFAELHLRPSNSSKFIIRFDIESSGCTLLNVASPANCYKSTVIKHLANGEIYASRITTVKGVGKKGDHKFRARNYIH